MEFAVAKDRDNENEDKKVEDLAENQDEIKENSSTDVNSVEESSTEESSTADDSSTAQQETNSKLKDIKIEDAVYGDDGATKYDEEELAMLAKSDIEIKDKINELMATGHMFKAHLLAKKAL